MIRELAAKAASINFYSTSGRIRGIPDSAERTNMEYRVVGIRRNMEFDTKCCGQAFL